MLGDSGCGKTSLMMQLSRGTFTHGTISTVGLDVVSKTMTIRGEQMAMQVWDTAGQENYRSVSKSYYRSAHAVMLVFDLTSIGTFQNVHRWLRDIAATMEQGPDGRQQCPLILVGNKADLAQLREVEDPRAREMAQDIGVAYFQTSAKTGEGVEAAFEFAGAGAARFRAENPTAATTNLADINTGPPDRDGRSRSSACAC